MEVQFDCSEDFIKYLGSTRFSTYDAFNSNLEAFQKASHTYFKPTSSTYFPLETIERQLLFYKYIRFACEMHRKSVAKNGFGYGGIGCPAYFTVGSRNSQLGVVKYYMVHNHEGYPEVEAADMIPEQCITEENDVSAGVDCTAIFLDIFKDKMFNSFTELQTKMDEFQRITGSLYGKRNTKRFPAESPYAHTLVYKSFAYECYHYGTHNCDASIQRVRRSAKIGCRSRIHVSCYRNKLKIVRFDVKHNHDVAPEHAKAYPRNRRLTQPQLAIVGSMFQANQDSHAIKDFIESKLKPRFESRFLDTFHTPCTMSDVRNIKAKLKASAQASAAAVVGAVEDEEVEEDEEDVLPNLPPLPQDTSLDDMITQLTPQLEHIQDLVISSPSREVLESRVNCLNRLIEVWQDGKEAIVLVPQRRVLVSTERREGELSDRRNCSRPNPLLMVMTTFTIITPHLKTFSSDYTVGLCVSSKLCKITSLPRIPSTSGVRLGDAAFFPICVEFTRTFRCTF
uniref:Transcription factor FAR1 n=1 Tax=Echinococcus granulosus TaxID=6210 RepID=A0A068WXX4_ECHGR|nr:Transcription factor FAR1 [Echinococcus granulosus]